MSFNSFHFLVFFVAVLVIAWRLRRRAGMRLTFLLIASYYFYMSWNVTYAALILGSTLLDFVAALRIGAASNARGRRAWLVVSLIGNLGILFVFKYYNFFADSVAGVLGMETGMAHHSFLLPVGISFYTFQSLSYTIDVYRGTLEPTRSFPRFALFVSFFPQLVAGPIVRASEFLPQLETPPRFDDRSVEDGLMRIFVGLFKKVCIADVLGTTLVDPAFADPTLFGSATLLLAMYAYSFQIYYDFCGYSDIAIGAAKMLGFHLPVNFNHPYRATSIRDYWRRWHISLSTWLRDYLYFPLGGGKGSTWRVIRNTTIVMLLGGLWHGAAWGFVIWGGLHGLLLGMGRYFHHVTRINADRPTQSTVSQVARIALTFHVIGLCFILFRGQDYATVTGYYGTLIALVPDTAPLPPLGLLVLGIAAGLEWLPKRWFAGMVEGYARMPAIAQAGVMTTALLLFAAIGQSATPFIYFQF